MIKIYSEEFVAVQLDISKAYNKVEWIFLKKAMEILRFSAELCEMIMACVSSAQYQMLFKTILYTATSYQQEV